MQEVLVKRLGGLSLPRKSVVRSTDCPVFTVDVKQQSHFVVRFPSRCLFRSLFCSSVQTGWTLPATELLLKLDACPEH